MQGDLGLRILKALGGFYESFTGQFRFKSLWLCKGSVRVAWGSFG